MKTEKLKTAAQLLIIVCIIAFASCKKDKEKPFDIMIDDIEIIFESAVARADDTIKFRLLGYIGPNQCYKLVEERTLFYPDPKGTEFDYIFEVFGIYEENKGMPCEVRESLLDCMIVIYPNQFEPGEYIFKVKRSDAFVEIKRLVIK